MEPNGAMFSTITSSSLLGVVDNNNPLQQQQNLQNPHHLHHSQQPLPFVPHLHDTDTNLNQQQQQQKKHSMKQGYPFFPSSKNKQQSTQLSDEDEQNFQGEESSGGDPKRKISPWQRMKWTDTMVRLLIMAVYYIGDETGSEGATDPLGNKKKSSGLLLQKKGKWKTVSRAMMEKGFYVSPQQCEDKFNDLNKRYKRVNDILGKGTACRVVENQCLLDSMDLTPKRKDEVRKLLNSKHLFFREMCAYHNSCGSSNVQHQVEGGTTTLQNRNQTPVNQEQQQRQEQHCLHSSENGVGNLRMLKMGNVEGEEEDDEEEEDESEDYSDEDGDESGEIDVCQIVNNRDEDANVRKSSRKRPRKERGLCSFSMSTSSSTLPLMHKINNEISSVLQDGGKSCWEKKQWIRNKIIELEEEKIRYESQGFELEKQRLKWERYSSKKEREMERDKLENERRKLENERMVLVIRQKEIEFMNLQQQQHSST